MPKKEVKKEKSLTKKEIVSCLAEDTGLGKNEVETFFDKLFDLIVDEARAGITIPGIC
jgi:nucleoid DNA-binding protein